MDDLDRVFQRLVQNLKGRSPEQLMAPFTVAELYEQLIPYRHNRRELGIETNQDYEIALTRLLSGERGYIVGDEKMQASLRSEMESSNPDTGAFREFATTEVSLAPSAAQSAPERGAAAPATTEASGSIAAIGGGGSGVTGVAALRSPPAPVPTSRPSRPGPIGDLRAPEGCRYCSGTLPEGRPVTFCPHCGQNLALHHCPACGTEIEQGWKFCVGCGRPAD